ncbi:hypothetical protein B5K11_25610 [Rhizobium leguminosarum bv. trifolii]|uniref:LysE family translocator n=1 Tax=Rhizobium leguminosarum TaxID=384 RepID=UPI000E2EFE0C|nr:LysE family translocator [Rhizobium leguminosarum]RFB88825.1 hypothetical protein B5K11_25610 [Rhizobium leguminosarum bv. trifolii]
MEYTGTLVTLASVFALGLISPGPNFVIVTSTAIGHSRRAGMMAAMGLAAASLTWTLLAILGIGILISQVQWVYAAVKVTGAVYLIWLGIKMMIPARMEAAIDGPAVAEGWLAFKKAYFVSLTNPKSAAFFASIFAAMIPAHAPLWLYVATLVMAGSFSAIWHGALAIFFSNTRVQARFQAWKNQINAVLGGVLILLGVKLLVSR